MASGLDVAQELLTQHVHGLRKVADDGPLVQEDLEDLLRVTAELRAIETARALTVIKMLCGSGKINALTTEELQSIVATINDDHHGPKPTP